MPELGGGAAHDAPPLCSRWFNAGQRRTVSECDAFTPGASFAVITISHSKPLAPELRRIQLAAGWRDYRIAGTNMPKMDECRRKAEECLRWADEAANDQQRETLLEIARLWTQMELSSAEPNGVDGAAQVSRFPEAPKS